MLGLRPYIHPPYKYQTSNYENRMKNLRQKTANRINAVADDLRAISDHQLLSELLTDLQRTETVEKLQWITSTIDEMDDIVKTLHVDHVTRKRVEHLKNITDELFSIIHSHKHKHLHSSSINVAQPEIVSDTSTLTPRAIVKTHAASKGHQQETDPDKCGVLYSELLHTISQPFWPQKKTAATKERKSAYIQDSEKQGRIKTAKNKPHRKGQSGKLCVPYVTA